jgi:DNA modification methylase
VAERSGGTSTSNFGVGRREGHDSTGFYKRFHAPEISDDETVALAPDLGDGCFVGDARRMRKIPTNSVALVVTSPPYFAGKEYEEALGVDGVPASYKEFLELLHAVFTECKRVLEPGGRIAVNVANLGRKPYRSLSGDVIDIFDDLGLLLRGEVIWKKGEGAAGNCAWGSFRSAANPVLRDITERVIIASKGRFNRARTPQQRRVEGLPFENSLTSDEFMSATLDVWDIEPESARRVSHPAPFPVQLPERLIHLYTYKGDLVLDPFLGSGSTLVAARRTGRRGAGFDVDGSYVDLARARLQEEAPAPRPPKKPSKRTPQPRPVESAVEGDFQARSSSEGRAARSIAKQALIDAGFRIVSENKKIPRTGVLMNFVAVDADELPWYFDVTGAFTTTRGGLLRSDTVWKCLGRAHVIQNTVNLEVSPKTPVVFLTSDLPKKGSEGDVALHAAGPAAFFDAMEMMSPADCERLALYAAGGHYTRPAVGYWTERELQRLL